MSLAASTCSAERAPLARLYGSKRARLSGRAVAAECFSIGGHVNRLLAQYTASRREVALQRTHWMCELVL
jgi:hypothetical protein